MRLEDTLTSFAVTVFILGLNMFKLVVTVVLQIVS